MRCRFEEKSESGLRDTIPRRRYLVTVRIIRNRITTIRPAVEGPHRRRATLFTAVVLPRLIRYTELVDGDEKAQGRPAHDTGARRIREWIIKRDVLLAAQTPSASPKTFVLKSEVCVGIGRWGVWGGGDGGGADYQDIN